MSNHPVQLPIVNLNKDSKKSLIKIKLADLPPNEQLISPGSPKELNPLIESISLHGQTDPIEVTKDANGNYIVIAGRRRIKALRVLNEACPDDWKTVDAICYSDIGPATIHSLSTIENNVRNENPLTDLEAIEYFQKTNPGISLSDISKHTGIPVSRIKKRLRLLSLLPEIKNMVYGEKVTVSVAENIAKLSQSKQEELIRKYAEKGKLSNDDVLEVQRAVVQNNANLLPSFEDLETYQEEEILGYVGLVDGEVVYKATSLDLLKQSTSFDDKVVLGKIIKLQ